MSVGGSLEPKKHLGFSSICLKNEIFFICHGGVRFAAAVTVKRPLVVVYVVALDGG